VTSPGAKRPRHEADHSPPCSAKLKNDEAVGQYSGNIVTTSEHLSDGYKKRVYSAHSLPAVNMAVYFSVSNCYSMYSKRKHVTAL
jgi:hypothetical protein